MRTEDEVPEGCTDDDFDQWLERWMHLGEIRILYGTFFVIIIMSTVHKGIIVGNKGHWSRVRKKWSSGIFLSLLI